MIKYDLSICIASLFSKDGYERVSINLVDSFVAAVKAEIEKLDNPSNSLRFPNVSTSLFYAKQKGREEKGRELVTGWTEISDQVQMVQQYFLLIGWKKSNESGIKSLAVLMKIDLGEYWIFKRVLPFEL